MSRLFSPLQLRSLEAKNRIMVSPMCQYSSVDGFANDWHFVHLGTRAVGGAGIVMTEAASVSPEGRISHADLGIWKDDHISELRRITDFISNNGSIPAIQLAHAGRKASKSKPWEGNTNLAPTHENGWEVVAPSAIPFLENDPVPHALTKEEITKVVEEFKSAIKRALEAGFKIIELHAAHGYLIHQFLSPISNKRTDEYGGSFENRIRFLIEIVDASRAIIPENLPLFVRISATDWIDDEPSWTLEDSVKLSNILKEYGVDLIDTSSGGLSSKQKIEGGAGYQVKFAETIKKEAEIMTGAVGLITSAQQAETIINTGQADLAILARELLRNPYFPLETAQELRAEIDWPKQYERAKL